MVNIIDVVIIAIALMAALGALLLLRPQVHQRDTHEIRKIRIHAEQEQRRIAEVLNTIQYGAQDAGQLTEQLKVQVEQISQDSLSSRGRAEDAERTIERVREAEHELRAISTQLGDRIQYVQTYWDEQLSDTVETVRNVHKRLTLGLTQVDEGMVRLREQEKMAQGFTQKLVEHQKSQFASQQENARLASLIHNQLESMMQESGKTLETMQHQHQKAEEMFRQFSTELQDLERQAQESFAAVFQATDAARQEVQAGLSESRERLNSLRQQDEQGTLMNQRIRQQFEQVDKLQVERLAQTVDITDEMCADLQAGLENARQLLQTLEAKTEQVINEVEPLHRGNESPSDKAQGANLFSLSAYR